MKSFKQILESTNKLNEKLSESEDINEDADFIQQHLADKDINSSVQGKNVKVHKSNVAATKRHLQKAGYKDHKVVSGLNESEDSREYDYEGEMAVTQLTTAIRHAEHLKDMMKPNTNLPEWVQSKITLATDYLQTAHDYIMSEMNEEVEQIDEISKATLGSYVNKSFSAGNELHDKIKAETDPEKKAKLQAKLSQRNQGVMKAGKKFRSEETDDQHYNQQSQKMKDAINLHLRKGKSYKDAIAAAKVHVKEETELDEETEEQKKARQEFDLKMAKAKNSQRATKALNKEETVLSFTEFGLALSEGRIDDLKDKMEVDRANTSAYSNKFKPTNTSKIGVKRVPARSYGAGVENDDEEEKSQEKRGRGRPAGSKSGARA
jgi:hypothetical protein